MVKVYFESNSHAELVAIFRDEEMYMLCSPALEKEAEENRMIVTESIEDEVENFDRIEIINKEA